MTAPTLQPAPRASKIWCAMGRHLVDDGQALETNLDGERACQGCLHERDENPCPFCESVHTPLHWCKTGGTSGR